MQSFSLESATTTQIAKLSKQQILAINKVKWVMIYSIVILLTESCFFFFLCYSTLAVNALLLINNIYSLYYTYKTLNTKAYLSEEYNKVLGNKLRLDSLFYVMIVDLIVSVSIYHIGFITYDEYEKYFTYVYLIVSLMKISIVKWGSLLLGNLEKLI